MSFCSERTFLRLPSCEARNIRCLKLRTHCSARCQSTSFQSVHPLVPFATRAAFAVRSHLTCPSVGNSYFVLSSLTWLTSAPFRAKYLCIWHLYPAGYVFPVSFDRRHSLLEPSFSRRGQQLLRAAFWLYQAPSGLSRSAPSEMRRV